MVELHKCAFCDIKWVNPVIEEVCIDCKEPYLILQTVAAVTSSIADLNKVNLNKIDRDQRRALRNSSFLLESVLEVLEKYPPKE